MTGRVRWAGYIGVTDASMSKAAGPRRAMILPLALAQFFYLAVSMIYLIVPFREVDIQAPRTAPPGKP
jgi:hypothetical protein